MRLGLIGTGKQGQRYLQERNGGRHIVVSGSRSIPLDGVDGVIIATHPAGHKALALEAIAAGKHVLCEKPLALNLADCEDIIDAAQESRVALMVAHTHCWSNNWTPDQIGTDVRCSIAYSEHNRDYSPWLDWAPHGLALLAQCTTESKMHLASRLALFKADEHHLMVCGSVWHYMPGMERQDGLDMDRFFSPMWRMTRAFADGQTDSYDFNRRVYRALFAQENHGTT